MHPQLPETAEHRDFHIAVTIVRMQAPVLPGNHRLVQWELEQPARKTNHSQRNLAKLVSMTTASDTDFRIYIPVSAPVPFYADANVV